MIFFSSGPLLCSFSTYFNPPSQCVPVLLQILVHVGFLTEESGDVFSPKVLKGGPLGEMVQWADILTALHVLGHNLKISMSVKELQGWVTVCWSCRMLEVLLFEALQRIKSAEGQEVTATAENKSKLLSELVLREASRWHFSSWPAALLHVDIGIIQTRKHVSFWKEKGYWLAGSMLQVNGLITWTKVWPFLTCACFIYCINYFH